MNNGEKYYFSIWESSCQFKLIECYLSVQFEFVSIYWDEKLVQEGRDFTAFEHTVVLSSHRNGAMLLDFENYFSRKRKWQKSS